MDQEPILILCTAPNPEVGATLARGLVEERLAACVNLVPGLRSIYVWKGRIEDESEVQLLIKSRGGRAADIEAWLTEHHPYDVPEILILPVRGGSEAYLGWLREQTVA